MIRGIILDLDGTVYRGTEEIPGASEFVRQCQQQARRCLFVTNRTNRTPEEVCLQLSGFGIPCGRADVLTASEATARYLRGGSVFTIGEEGLRQALEQAGLTFNDDAPDYVVVGFDRGFTYAKLKKACELIEAGAKFVATNPDKCLKIENGVSPGTGAIVAAVAAGSGHDPVVIGKPEPLIMEMALDRLGLPAGEVIAVGDNLETDMPAGAAAGIRTALILTGVSRCGDVDKAGVKPTWIVKDYEALGRLIAEEEASGL